MARAEILQQNGHDFLWIDGRLWMWDVEEEIEDQREIAEKASGNVLVAGYGLGIVQRFLFDNRNVASVLTIENEPEVLRICRMRYGRLFGDVVLTNFYNFESQTKFDTVIGDIWESVSRRYLPEYERFKGKALELLKYNGKVLGWGLDYFEYLLEKRKTGEIW